MFSVENHFIHMLFQKSDGVVQNFEVSLERDTQGLTHMQIPGLTYYASQPGYRRAKSTGDCDQRQP